MLDAGNLLGDILGVHVVHNGTERGNIVRGGIHARIDAVQQGEIAHPMLREIPLHIVPCHDVITPQAGEVFCNDHVDLFRLNVGNEPLKSGAVES